MKKFILLLFFIAGSFSCFAQKKYLLLTLGNSEWELCGDIPNGMKSSYPVRSFEIKNTLITILNNLSENGYCVEYMFDKNTFVLSKNSPAPLSTIQKIDSNEDENIREVSRYNLQGIPISEKEKGIQIIVYSNFTTKTVIVK
jgi:hypothetical protein